MFAINPGASEPVWPARARAGPARQGPNGILSRHRRGIGRRASATGGQRLPAARTHLTGSPKEHDGYRRSTGWAAHSIHVGLLQKSSPTADLSGSRTARAVIQKRMPRSRQACRDVSRDRNTNNSSTQGQERPITSGYNVGTCSLGPLSARSLSPAQEHTPRERRTGRWKMATSGQGAQTCGVPGMLRSPLRARALVGVGASARSRRWVRAGLKTRVGSSQRPLRTSMPYQARLPITAICTPPSGGGS